LGLSHFEGFRSALHQFDAPVMYGPILRPPRPMAGAGGWPHSTSPLQASGTPSSTKLLALIAVVAVVATAAIVGLKVHHGWAAHRREESRLSPGPRPSSADFLGAPAASYAPVAPPVPVQRVVPEAAPPADTTTTSTEAPEFPERCSYALGGGGPRPPPGPLWCQSTGLDIPEVCAYDEPGGPIQVKVLTYNLFWWGLAQSGGARARGALISGASRPAPYDFMGFQECEDVNLVLASSGLAGQYLALQGPHAVALALRKARWALLANGQADVAEDSALQYFGRRISMWARVRDKGSGKTVFFMNHHGPTPIGSGGLCGGNATAHNLLRVIRTKSQPSDAVILVGDFNADPSSDTFKSLSLRLHPTFSFTPHGDVDQIFSNLGPTPVIHKAILPGGGSDHHPLSVVLKVSKVGKHPGKAPFERPVFVGWA